MPAKTDLMAGLIKLAEQAGDATRVIYDRGCTDVSLKNDNSPLTAADQESHKIICTGLATLSALPVLSEESEAITVEERQRWSAYWLVDPLDGTKEFINRSGDFTINIALIENGRPVIGVVYAPVVDELYFAQAGKGAFLKLGPDQNKKLVVRHLPPDGRLCGLVSRSHLGNEASSIRQVFPNVELVPMGSSLKFCHIAAAKADFYLRAKPTSEWDTAAAQAILEQAGGKVSDLTGNSLVYNKDNILNPSFIAFGDPRLPWKELIPAND